MISGIAVGGGSFEEVDIADEFRAAALKFIDPANVKAGMKIVADGGNGRRARWSGPCSTCCSSR